MESHTTRVPGLRYISDYLTTEEQHQILTDIDQQPWLTELKRRVQHYGYKYDYSRRSISGPALLGALPAWGANLARRLAFEGWVMQPVDQIIVNEYEPGQGIAAHIDHVRSFGDTIVSISLNSTCVITYTHTETNQKVPVLVEPGSLIVMQDEARYKWRHGIAARKRDVFEGKRFDRARRVSLTFRSVRKQTA